jgi:hypothetical protein
MNRVRDRVDEFKESFAIFVAHRETVACSDAPANGASSKSSPCCASPV